VNAVKTIQTELVADVKRVEEFLLGYTNYRKPPNIPTAEGYICLNRAYRNHGLGNDTGVITLEMWGITILPDGPDAEYARSPGASLVTIEIAYLPEPSHTELTIKCLNNHVFPYCELMLAAAESVLGSFNSRIAREELKASTRDGAAALNDWMGILSSLADELKDSMSLAKNAENILLVAPRIDPLQFLDKQLKKRIKEAWDSARNSKRVPWAKFQLTVIEMLGFVPQRRTVNDW
jgi:hypothetical protein